MSQRYIPVFKALGEPTRMRIVKLLSSREDLCVCELKEIMQISQPRISQHLKILKQAGLVRERREGQRRVCNLDFAAWEDLCRDFNDFLDTPLEDMTEYREESARLKEIFSGPATGDAD